MGMRRRLGFAALAIIIAAVAAVTLGSGSNDRTEKADRPPADVQGTATPEPQQASPAETPAATPTPRPRPKTRVVRIRNGEVVGGRARLTFTKNTTARFAISSDTADEVHVHGYDLEKPVPAGGTARFAFRADIDGIFEVELHGTGLEVAQLRVEP